MSRDQSPGIEPVVPGSQSTLPDIDISISPRRSEWLPELLADLLPLTADAVRRRVAERFGTPACRRYPSSFVEGLGREHGVTALGGDADAEFGRPGVYASALVNFATREWDQCSSQDLADDHQHEMRARAREQHVSVLTTDVAGLGAWDCGLDGLRDGPVAVHRSLDPQTRVVRVRFDSEAWTGDHDRRTAARTLDALSALAEGVHVQLQLSSPQLVADLLERHRDWFESDLDLTERWQRDQQEPADSEPAEVEIDEIQAIVEDLSAQTAPVRLIDSLPTEGSRTVAALKDDPIIDAAERSVDVYVSELESAGVLAVERSTTSSNRVSLTPLGAEVKDCTTDDMGLRDPLQQTVADICLTPAHQTRASTVCRAQNGIGTEGTLARTGDPSEEGWVQWLPAVDEQMDKWAVHRRFLAARRGPGISLVDDRVEDFENDEGDGRVTYISLFEDEALMLVQWGGALPTMARIAATLLDNKLVRKALSPDAVGDEFDELYQEAASEVEGHVDDILRLGCQMGWFSEDEKEWNSWQERYSGLKCLCLKRLGEITQSTEPEHEARQELMNDLHGLIASATQLFYAADVDLTINVRVPDVDQLTRDNQHGTRRYNSFLDFLRFTVPKQAVFESETGAHSVWRAVRERREDKLKHRLPLAVDDDPTAHLTADWIISGPSVTALQEDIQQVLEEEANAVREDVREGREDAPVLQIPVRKADTQHAIKGVLAEFVEYKNYDLQDVSQDQDARDDVDTLVRLLCATLGTEDRPHSANPCDVAEVLLRLASSTRSRDHLSLDDLEAGLSRLPSDRLLPDVRPSTTEIIQTVLQADEPIGRSTIVERASISASTYDRRVDEASALDILQARTVGGHRKWSASLAPWWSSKTDKSRPANIDSGFHSAVSTQGVLFELICALDLDIDHDRLSWPPDIEGVISDNEVLRNWKAFIINWEPPPTPADQNERGPVAVRIGPPETEIAGEQTGLDSDIFNQSELADSPVGTDETA